MFVNSGSHRVPIHWRHHDAVATRGMDPSPGSTCSRVFSDSRRLVGKLGGGSKGGYWGNMVDERVKPERRYLEKCSSKYLLSCSSAVFAGVWGVTAGCRLVVKRRKLAVALGQHVLSSVLQGLLSDRLRKENRQIWRLHQVIFCFTFYTTSGGNDLKDMKVNFNTQLNFMQEISSSAEEISIRVHIWTLEGSPERSGKSRVHCGKRLSSSYCGARGRT